MPMQGKWSGSLYALHCVLASSWSPTIFEVAPPITTTTLPPVLPVGKKELPGLVVLERDGDARRGQAQALAGKPTAVLAMVSARARELVITVTSYCRDRHWGLDVLTWRNRNGGVKTTAA